MSNDLEELLGTGGFDAEKVEPGGNFEPLPPDDYEVVITDSAVKPTKDGSGKYLELRLEVQRGPHANRVLFDRLNLVNRNDTAVQIAKATLSSICRAVGVMTPKDSSDLHSKPLLAVVKMRKREDTGEMSNEVKGYKASPLAVMDRAEKDVVENPQAGDEIPF
jgi:hypothetical protein